MNLIKFSKIIGFMGVISILAGSLYNWISISRVTDEYLENIYFFVAIRLLAVGFIGLVGLILVAKRKLLTGGGLMLLAGIIPTKAFLQSFFYFGRYQTSDYILFILFFFMSLSLIAGLLVIVGALKRDRQSLVGWFKRTPKSQSWAYMNIWFFTIVYFLALGLVLILGQAFLPPDSVLMKTKPIFNSSSFFLSFSLYQVFSLAIFILSVFFITGLMIKFILNRFAMQPGEIFKKSLVFAAVPLILYSILILQQIYYSFSHWGELAPWLIIPNIIFCLLITTSYFLISRYWLKRLL